MNEDTQEKNNTAGHYHPMTKIMHRVVEVFDDMGFDIFQIPELDTEEFNFDFLNVPESHPARDEQDTFWIKDAEKLVARTQMTSGQIHGARKYDAPLKTLFFGKVYRNETTDATHEAVFHQFECSAIGTDLNLAHMKFTIQNIITKLFGEGVTTRLRPGYFPFVEPGVEVDMSCFKCEGKGCRVCKQSGWIEILGAGMLHPKVLERGGVNPNEHQGYAFAFGWDRIAMLLHEIDDIRLIQSGDLRFVNQFK
jgi:phenylalanyl-tRNA synthetase alpha chain